MTRLHLFALWTLAAWMLASCEPGVIGESPITPDGSTSDASPSPDAPDVPTPDAPPPVPDAPPPIPCVDGDEQVLDPDTGHCYMVYRGVLDWEQAFLRCEDIGAHLMDITSAVENQLVLDLAGALDTWMGGNDRLSEGAWKWLNGDSFTYTNWRDGEPNNSTNSDMINGEDCGILEGARGGTWDDRPCTLREYQFICERE